ncbi:2-phosphoglycolate phosphatase 2 [Actinidia rufa]|uniref:phosphoglycolate phosphatase n=1 Tax=Actinidia rufa TaxID=165716 RepID=A0A7J0DZI9_9ERIC|nr:2-phosphoglycolate phosphatase 2 [Actinidia rufa]
MGLIRRYRPSYPGEMGLHSHPPHVKRGDVKLEHELSSPRGAGLHSRRERELSGPRAECLSEPCVEMSTRRELELLLVAQPQWLRHPIGTGNQKWNWSKVIAARRGEDSVQGMPRLHNVTFGAYLLPKVAGARAMNRTALILDFKVQEVWLKHIFLLTKGGQRLPLTSAAKIRTPATMNDGASPSIPQLLSPQNATDLFHSVDAFLFDCDGVIWKGDKLIDGVPHTLEMLRSKGKKLIFVTNNSTKSRRQYAKKFHSLGIAVTEEEIFSSSFAAAMFLKVNEFPPEKKVYVIGEEGILDELELADFIGLGGPEDGKKMVHLKPNYLFEHDKSVGAVVVGLDQYINYYKLQYATLCIRENPGCLFVATNRDAVGHMTDLQEWPGAGCMVGAVCGSTQKEPIVVGKPSTFMMDSY